MKVLYIAKRSKVDIGSVVHLRAIKEIYDAENVYHIDLLESQRRTGHNFLSVGYQPKKIMERIKRYLEGNSPFISNSIIREICDIISKNKIELVFTEESDFGNLYRTIKSKFPNVKIVCFFHDISADLFATRIKDAPKWKQHYIAECKNIIRQEDITQKYVDECWVFHDTDAKRFKAHYGYEPKIRIPIAAPIPKHHGDWKAVTIGANQKKNILFVCSSYYVNIKGFKWFYDHVLPGVINNYHIVVVGSGAQQLNDFVANDEIEIIGRVDSMTPFYENADIVIAPVFDGGGMKVKTIEALSFGKTIISTTESLNGYWEWIPNTVRNKMIYQCDTADEWISACNQLISSEINRFNIPVFEVFKNYFSYEVLLKSFRKNLNEE